MAPEIGNALSNQLKNSPTVTSSMLHMPQGSFQATQNSLSIPPPLPPRHIPSNYPEYNDYRPFGSNFYGSYGNYGYRGFGGYGLFGNHLPFSDISAYNNYGQLGGYNLENRFQQYAEESTRSTFHIIEAVLHTFSSITTVLESTYFALTSSFRAILSVAENIGRLRSTIGNLLSTLALIRCLKWIYKKILYVLGFRRQNTSNEELWKQSFLQTANTEEQTSYTWPNLLLLTALTAIPYLIHKISSNVRQMHIQANDPNSWLKCKDPVSVASAQYDFTAASNEELNLKAGQKIWLAPRSLQPKNMPGWWLATDSKNVGLIPANYVILAGHLKKLESERKNVTTSLHHPHLTVPTYMQTETIPCNKQEMTCVNTSESQPFHEQSIFFENNKDKDNIEYKSNIKDKSIKDNKREADIF